MLYPYMNRAAIVNNMYPGEKSSALRDLVFSLNNKELDILKRNPDLVKALKDLSQEPMLSMVDRLESYYELEIAEQDDNIWVETADLEKRVPPALRNTNTGLWWSGAADFTRWARQFLLQEIRINLWTRYLDYKKKNPEPSHHSDLAGIWGGYGGYV